MSGFSLFIRLYDKFHRVIERQRLKMLAFGKRGGEGIIGTNNRFYSAHNIYLDDFVHIGNGNRFYADATITIREGTIIADNCEFRTANHYYDGVDLRMLPYDQRVICKPITIAENCWIGTQVIILPGVTVNEGAVIGAGSVVSKDIPSYAVVCGNPAKIVKYRSAEIYSNLANSKKQIMRCFGSYKREKIMEDVRK